MLKYLNGCYSACMNSCGFYKQLTWLVSKSPPPASTITSLCMSVYVSYLGLHFVHWLSEM